MALIRWDPFREFDRFFDEDWGMVPMMRGVARVGFPPVDISQTEKEVVVEVGVPAGIDPEKVDVSVAGEMLTVKGSSEEEREEKDKHYYRKEMRRGAFERSVMLPAAVKGEQADAVYEKGVLKITIPKAEEERAKKVQVRVRR